LDEYLLVGFDGSVELGFAPGDYKGRVTAFLLGRDAYPKVVAVVELYG